MSKSNEVGGGGGGRAERIPAVGKPFISGVGWVLNVCSVCLCKGTGSLWKEAAAFLPDTNVPAAQVPCARHLLWLHLREQHRFMQDVQGWMHSHQQGKSKLTEYPTSSTCQSSELAHQTISWFLYLVTALSLFPQGSQVSIGNSAMKSWFCQRFNSRSPSGRKAAQWAQWEEADG